MQFNICLNILFNTYLQFRNFLLPAFACITCLMINCLKAICFIPPKPKFSRLILAILFRPFDFLAHKDFKIIWLSNILTLSVPDAGYSRNVSCALILISTFLFHSILTSWELCPIQFPILLVWLCLTWMNI